MLKFYESQNILTLLHSSKKNSNLHMNEIKLLCNVLTGEIVDWSEKLEGKHIFNSEYPDNSSTLTNSFESGASSSKSVKVVFKRERLHGKSEFDFMEHLSSTNSKTFSDTQPNTMEAKPTKVEEVKSKVFNTQLIGNAGTVLGKFWKSMENIFIENMENCFFNRRILILEQEPYATSINMYLNDILYKQNIDKIELINRLQSDLFNVPDDALKNPDVTQQLLLTVSDVKVLLIQLIITKIENCRRFIENESIENWLDKQITSMILVYRCILQTEVC